MLGTLAAGRGRGPVDVAGCVDATQLAYVHQQWAAMKVSAWKIPLLETIFERAPFSGKNSTPWAPGSLHDFMHAKVTVADDVVFCGSFNLSRSGERNAEDMLEIHDAALAERLADFIDGVAAPLPALHARGRPNRPSGSRRAYVGVSRCDLLNRSKALRAGPIPTRSCWAASR